MKLTTPTEAVEAFERYKRDLAYACPVRHCRARPGEPCRDVPAGKVHQSRRVQRLNSELDS